MNGNTEVVDNAAENGSLAPLYQQQSGTPDGGGELVLRPVRVHGKRPGSAKIVIDIDRTDSTRNFSAAVPVIVGYALRSLETTIAKLNIDLLTHGDEECNEKPVQMVQSGNVDQVVEAIAGIKYGGGFDAEETHAEQLQRILDLTHWGMQMLHCRNIVIGLLTADTKPLRSGKPMRQLGAEYRTKGVKLVLVCEVTPSLQELVDAAGGFLIPISNNPDKAEVMKVTESLCATLTMPLMAGGGTIPMSSVGV